MQQSRGLGHVDVGAKLGGERGGNHRGFQRVAEHILAVGGAELETSQELDQVGMQTGDVRLVGDLLPFFSHHLLQLGARLGDDLLDPGGMDAAVLQELVERAPGDLAPHRVEGRDRDRLGRIVDDQVDTGRRLQGTDIAPLAPDDPALHVIRRKRNDRDS
jgi:hypothetical protein